MKESIQFIRNHNLPIKVFCNLCDLEDSIYVEGNRINTKVKIIQYCKSCSKSTNWENKNEKYN